ncbi:MAG: hypothetical protein OEZ36_01990 [Spirochaetota bacterium]|nr:hypothetical protein [Spirochaetota bacterium]
MSDLFEKLPLCRKERYYTSCVLPQIICGNGFGRLRVFQEKLDVPVEFIRDPYTPENLSFYTEYSHFDSSKVKNAKQKAGDDNKISHFMLCLISV